VFSHKQSRTFSIRRSSDESINKTDRAFQPIYSKNSRNRRGFSLIWLVFTALICGLVFYFFDTLFF